jgi:transcriptional regulator with XRE-family HTH domain
MDDLGKRISAARAYAGINRTTLADGLTISKPALERLESGLDVPEDSERRSLIKNMAIATQLPEQFFTVDYAELAAETSPEHRLDQLDETLRSIDGRLGHIAAKLGVE